MSNYHLRDNTISFKAKGILSMFLSLPKNWNYSVSGLAAISKEGKNGILSGLKELEATGYLERHRYRNERGRLGDSEYVIYEIPPHRRPVLATPEQGLPKLEKPDSTADAKRSGCCTRPDLQPRSGDVYSYSASGCRPSKIHQQWETGSCKANFVSTKGGAAQWQNRVSKYRKYRFLSYSHSKIILSVCWMMKPCSAR